jgi:glycine cleavage system H protein
MLQGGPPPQRRYGIMDIDGYIFPDDLLYDRSHNWARIDGNTATIGLTDFGQDLAGEIVYAEVPLVGRSITYGEPFMRIESGKWVGQINAIVSGKIIEANREIEQDGLIINEDPYGAGWVAKVEIGSEPQGLMKTSDPVFAEFIAAERKRYDK